MKFISGITYLIPYDGKSIYVTVYKTEDMIREAKQRISKRLENG